MLVEIVKGSQEHLSTEAEETFSYQRSDGLKITMTVCYVDNGSAIGGISAWTSDDCKTGEPSHTIDMSCEELRYLRALLNRPEVAAMLDEDVIL